MALRKALPAFWGRRAAKALAVSLGESTALHGLAQAMRDTAKWGAAPPDFYALALVPIRIADGDDEAQVHASFGYVKGTDPYANALCTLCTSSS